MNISLKDKQLHIISEDLIGNEQVILDKICNFENIHNEDLEEHTLVTNLSEFNKVGNEYTLDINNLNVDIIIVSINNIETIVFDEVVLYKDMSSIFRYFCNECLDKNQKQQIAACGLRFQLFLIAIKNNLIEDSINHHISLYRALNSLKTCNTAVYSDCGVCKNGMCKL